MITFIPYYLFLMITATHHSSAQIKFDKSTSMPSRIQTHDTSAACTCCSEVEDLQLTLQEHNFQLEQNAKQTKTLQNKINEFNEAVKQRDIHIKDLSSNINRLVSLGSNCTEHTFALQRESEALRITTLTTRTMCQNAGANMELIKLETGRYYLSDNNYKLNWYEAMKFCKFHGLEFASIESSKENEKLIEKIVELGFPINHRYLLSGSDLGKEGQWYWSSTGQDIVYSTWHRNQPDNHKNNQNCLSIWNLNGTIKWDDTVCESKQRFICEMSHMCRHL